ncbi:MAG: hypothetical protein HYU88_00905 [Chloroflexi bacterium]|nr:hypothetical protein [Chloroflexota bacterium]MBI4504529.1 hypothetical protein [Chloroflexota bacterium]
MAHAIIPSLLQSHHLPRRVGAVRPVFYVVALAGAVSAVFAIVNWIQWLGVLYDIFPRVVI